MNIFEFKNYVDYLQNWLKSKPKAGHGYSKKIAEALGVSTTYVSQFIRGDKVISLEQAAQVCRFLELTELETLYFLKLVSIDRAGTADLKSIFEKERVEILEQSKKISKNLKVNRVLTDDEKALFYSDWLFSALRLQCGIGDCKNVDELAKKFDLPRDKAVHIVNFLLRTSLLKEERGRLRVGPSRTHLDSSSPFIKMHHTNWRLKALENLKSNSENKLHYSAPMTLSRRDIKKIRKMIISFISEAGKVLDPSPPEELMCLNIDWFEVAKSTDN